MIIATYGSDDWWDLANGRADASVPYPQEGLDRVLKYHQPFGTRASSLNQGAAQVEGDWLIFLDADDELAPGYIGAMRRALEQHPDGDQTLFTPAVQQIRKGRPGAPFFFAESDLTETNWLVIGTMISKRLFNEIGGFHEHPHGLEDWNLFARAVRAGATIVKVPDAVYVAHVNNQSKHNELRRNRREYMAAYETARLDAWG